MKRFWVLSLAALAALASGCVAGDDPYSRVIELCNTPVPNLGEFDVVNLYTTYLTPECKQALESVIPYDDTWTTAPTGFKDKVTESFQALLAYPIGLAAQNQIFGVSPPLAGAIPLEFYSVLQQRPNPNQSLFDYVLDNIDLATYGGSTVDGIDAHYTPSFSSRPRQMAFFDSFWEPSKRTSDWIRNPFIRASTLVHEARHGDGIFHVECNSSQSDGSTGFECDNELIGAYGFGLAYLHMLLEGGSATCNYPGCVPPLPPYLVMAIGQEICASLKDNFNSRFAALDTLLQNTTCNLDVTYDWVMSHEGIPLPPGPPPQPITLLRPLPIHVPKCNATGA